jgi:competence protein ComEA
MLRRYQQFIFGVLASLCITALLLIVARRPAGHPVILPPAPTVRPLRVYVTGAVVAPGVYSLPPASIAQDALQAAGGAGPQADLSQINLARPLADGDQLAVPTLAPTASPAPAITDRPDTPGIDGAAPVGTPPPPPTAADQKINLNSATVTELDTLPGIGPVIAQRIVDYRTQHGPFARPEDLLEVSGIGEATFNRIKESVVVGP